MLTRSLKEKFFVVNTQAKKKQWVFKKQQQKYAVNKVIIKHIMANSCVGRN